MSTSRSGKESIPQVRIRPFVTEDAERVASLCNNRNIFDNLRDFFPHPYTLQDAHDFIRQCMIHDPPLNFAILLEETLCGSIGLLPQGDVYTGSAEIGYWLGESFWGRGIMPEAIRQTVRYGFDTLHLRRIFTGVFSHNPASMKVLEKAGFRLEGIGRQAIIKNGIVRDEHHYAILRSDTD